MMAEVVAVDIPRRLLEGAVWFLAGVGTRTMYDWARIKCRRRESRKVGNVA